jgi:hypothetical protein
MSSRFLRYHLGIRGSAAAHRRQERDLIAFGEKLVGRREPLVPSENDTAAHFVKLRGGAGIVLENIAQARPGVELRLFAGAAADFLQYAEK